jgi:hypothetical protein
MTQDVRFSRDVSGDMLLQLQAKLDGGAGAMLIRLYDGTRRATPEASIGSSTLLAQSVSSNTTTCATETPTGTLTFASIPTVTAETFTSPSTRTATWAAWCMSDGTGVFDCDVGVVGSQKFIEMVSTSVVSGAPVAFSSATITFP